MPHQLTDAMRVLIAMMLVAASTSEVAVSFAVFGVGASLGALLLMAADRWITKRRP